jgi:hypothetical protein
MSEIIISDPEEYVGAVLRGGVWRFFYADFGIWILDYASYDSKDSVANWRNSLRVIDEDNADEFIDFLSKQEIPLDSLSSVQSAFGSPAKVRFVVNFDEKMFVNGWGDNIAIHDYVPSGWKGIEDDPYLYLPTDLKS